MRIKRFLICTLFFLIATGLRGQAEKSSTIDEKVSHQEVIELTEELDLRKQETRWTPKPSEKEAEPEEEFSPEFFTSLVSHLVYYFLIFVIIVLVIGILIYFFSNIQDDRKTSLDIPEEEEEILDIKAVDLDEMLRIALESQNYKLAIRAKFLMILKELSAEKHIIWSHEKTNREYIRELRSSKFSNFFRSVANIYERVWYGDIEVDKSTYTDTTPIFARFEQLLKQKERLA